MLKAEQMIRARFIGMKNLERKMRKIKPEAEKQMQDGITLIALKLEGDAKKLINRRS